MEKDNWEDKCVCNEGGEWDGGKESKRERNGSVE